MRTRVRKQSIIALYFKFENELKFITSGPVVGVCNLVMLEAASSTTETMKNLGILHMAKVSIVLSIKGMTKALTRLRGCAGWSAPFSHATKSVTMPICEEQRIWRACTLPQSCQSRTCLYDTQNIG